ncbi:MAG: 3-dehydroquinate synthase [Gammaproteobacteria bacterium]|nr:MAG: 3-dehydroquinate synthase [Gammaproteobacteria bacterium]
MKTLELDLGSRSYPIHIGAGLLGSKDLLCEKITGGRAVIVSNTTVAPLYLPGVLDSIKDFDPISIVLPDGEQYKNLDTLNQIYTALLEQHCDRQTTLIALGGGVIGDMTGFAAASYQRGIPFIQVPTTLLSQVDSSVGGKTGVNHALAKNMIGAFYQPKSVIIDIDTLQTLPDRELSAGLAEIIKYGLINDHEFFAWLEESMDRLMARDKEALTEAIYRSCENKARIVAQDEREAGVRALLNLGHTFGHSIEAGLGYGQWLHGEAVATGMMMAADLSRRLKWIQSSDVERVETLILRANLPVRYPDSLGMERFRSLMQLDKKNIAGDLRLVLLKGIGDAVITTDFSEALLSDTLRHGSIDKGD